MLVCNFKNSVVNIEIAILKQIVQVYIVANVGNILKKYYYISTCCI